MSKNDWIERRKAVILNDPDWKSFLNYAVEYYSDLFDVAYRAVNIASRTTDFTEKARGISALLMQFDSPIKYLYYDWNKMSYDQKKPYATPELLKLIQNADAYASRALTEAKKSGAFGGGEEKVVK